MNITIVFGILIILFLFYVNQQYIKNFNIDAINISFNGSVSNGNYVNIYVDDVVVASGIQPAYTKTWDIEDTVGRYVSYETVSEPHNEYLQVATWSEISEITVLAQEVVV